MSRLRRAAGAAKRRLRGPGPGPLLSVVVAVRGRAGHLEECLAGLLGGEHQAVEVLLAPEPGNARADAAVAASRLARSRRVRVLDTSRTDSKTASPTSSWLDEAVARARGEYLAFVDSDDIVAPDGYAALVGVLEETGSDLAVGAQRRAAGGRYRFAAAPESLFADRVLRVTAADLPELLVDVRLTNKVFRRSRWADRGLTLPAWGSAATTVARALLEATAVDVLPRYVYEEHARDISLPVDEQARFRTDLAAERVAALLAVDDLVHEGEPATRPDAVRGAWVAGALGHLLPPLCVDAVGGGPAFLEAVAPLARRLLDRADEQLLATVPVHPRLVAWAAAHGSLDDVALTEDLLADHPHGLPTERAATGARVVRLPAGLRVRVPETVRRIEAVDRRLRITVEPVLHRAGSTVRVRGAAFVEYAEHAPEPAVTIAAGPGGERVVAEVAPRHDPALNLWAERAFEDRAGSGFTATVAAERLPDSPNGRWQVEIQVGRRRETFAVHEPRAPEAPEASGPVLDEVALDEDVVLLGGAGGDPVDVRLVSGKGATARVPIVRVDDGRWSARVPLHIDLFGTSVLLPGGAWTVEVRGAGELRLPDLAWAPPLVASPPELVVERLRLVPAQDGGRGAVLRVGAPLGPDERSVYDQQRLVSSVYAAPATPSYTPTVLLETFRGRSVGDNPGAIGAELLARGLDLDLAWVVDDPSVTVPEGTRAVPRRTARWYDALANAHAYVGNAGAPYWFAKKRGQVHLQTWHGTPLKRIGEDRGPGDFQTWRHRRRIGAQAAAWDAMISPSPFCSEVFRSAFGYAGEMLEVGYPRNDVLVASEPDRRRRVREALGVSAGQRAVLYAPTWREYVGVRDAKPLYLDAERLTRLLPDTVVLVRGHYNSSTQADVFAGHDRIRDVTRYPDIAELYLASDVLVTDYSSVMFDYALTDRPIVLLTPDLEQYRDVERGFYFDLEGQAPGPMVTTTDAVAAALGAGDEHGPARRAFRERFCPWDDGQAAARTVDWLLDRL